MNADIEARLRGIVDRYFPDALAHGRAHVLRVVASCKEIATSIEAEKGQWIDRDVLLAAAYLHDTGRLGDMKPLARAVPPANAPHAERSAGFAREILQGMDGFPAAKIPAVEQAILAHSFSKGERPATIEGEILSDADKLDALGAQGIIRTVAYSVENGRSLQDTLDHFTEKILKLKDLLYTNPAKRIAAAKHEIVACFVGDLVHDIDAVPDRADSTSSR
ncbi:MAG: HD domain-containing protein [Candidatus Sigynarchaeota archaeon]